MRPNHQWKYLSHESQNPAIIDTRAVTRMHTFKGDVSAVRLKDKGTEASLIEIERRSFVDECTYKCSVIDLFLINLLS
ncbi:hypothetical protein vseg_000258 [Gypsophila vaccaria]